MKRESVTRASIAMGLVVTLAGCSSGLLNPKANVVPSNNVQVGNNLALPPDLSLPAPGTGPETYQTASVADDSIYGESSPAPKPAAPGQLTRGQVAAQNAANRNQGDVYDQYGISKFKPDGTKKEEWELKAELKAAILQRKKQQNPRYGTVFNMGNIWSDQ